LPAVRWWRCRSQRWPKKRDGPIAWVACLRILAISNLTYVYGALVSLTAKTSGLITAFASQIDLISQLAAELVIAQPDVIYAAGPEAVNAVQRATKSIPIVGITGDMVGEVLVKSFARPNGNITGISIFAPELDGLRQDLLIEAVPGIRRMAALADDLWFERVVKWLRGEAKVRALQEAARTRNVELSIYRVTRAEEIAATIDKAQASGATALNVLNSGMLDGNGPLIMERVAALRLPTMYQWGVRAEQGGFIGYGPSSDHLADLLPDSRRVFCAARCLPICRSNSRRNSSW